MDKKNALELLAVSFGALDERTRSGLYEEFKGGMYEARNDALASIGELKRRRLTSGRNRANAVWEMSATRVRERLIRLHEEFARVTSQRN